MLTRPIHFGIINMFLNLLWIPSLIGLKRYQSSEQFGSSGWLYPPHFPFSPRTHEARISCRGWCNGSLGSNLLAEKSGERWTSCWEILGWFFATWDLKWSWCLYMQKLFHPRQLNLTEGMMYVEFTLFTSNSSCFVPTRTHWLQVEPTVTRECEWFHRILNACKHI